MKRRRFLILILLMIPFGVGACQSPRSSVSPVRPASSSRSNSTVIRRVACIYTVNPWLNLDVEGDRDPEGVQYITYLDPGTGQGVLSEGMFHIRMYLLKTGAVGNQTRKLVSDWHYATDTFQVVRNRDFGFGYHFRLRWGKKNIAGSEVEIVTRFESPDGNIVGAGTKRIRVPKYGP